MNRLNKIFALLMVFVILMTGTAVSAFAAVANVTFENNAEKFIFLPGSNSSDTDLFDNFKNIMPGDTRTQTVVVTNDFRDYDKIKVYLRAKPHGEDNPLSASVAATETVASMEDFLSQFAMTVRADGIVIYNASPNEVGGLKDNILIGEIACGETVKLDISLSMPLDVGNEYSNRIGEVDWVFTVEQVEEGSQVVVPMPARETIKAIKMIDGRTPDTNEFKFQLTDTNGNVIQIVNNKGAEVIFNTIAYYTPGVYTYYLTEIPGTRDDVFYDPTVYTVTVTVLDPLGLMTSEVSITKDDVAYIGTPVFYNKTGVNIPVVPQDPVKPVDPVDPIEPEDPETPEDPTFPETPSTSESTFVSLFATTTLNQHLAVNSDFTFDLTDENGALLQTKENDGGYVFFEQLQFDKSGTYVYYLTEKQGDIDGMIYDSAVYKITVQVIEISGKLESIVTYEKNGLEYNDTPLFANRTAVDDEIPSTSDTNPWFFIIPIFAVLVAVIISYMTTKKSKENI